MAFIFKENFIEEGWQVDYRMCRLKGAFWLRKGNCGETCNSQIEASALSHGMRM